MMHMLQSQGGFIDFEVIRARCLFVTSSRHISRQKPKTPKKKT